MKDFVSSQGGLIATVTAIVMAMNVALTALKSILDMFQKKQEQLPAGQPAPVVPPVKNFVDKALGFVSGLLDWLSANKPH